MPDEINVNSALNALVGSDNPFIKELNEIKSKETLQEEVVTSTTEVNSKETSLLEEEKEDVVTEGGTPHEEETLEEETLEEEIEAINEEGTINKNGEDIVIKSPLLGGEIKINKKKPEEDAGGLSGNFENIDDLTKSLKEKHNIDDLNIVFDKLSELEEKKEELDKISTEMGNIQSLFQNMPSALYQAISAYEKGESWREKILSNDLDLTKSVDSFSDKEIVDAMSPGKVTEEDWEEYKDEDGDPNIKRYVSALIETSKSSFNSKKASFDKAIEDNIAEGKKRNEMFNSSIEASKSRLKSQFGDVDMSLVNDIEKIFKQPQGINSIFYDENGMLKDDAFARMAMAQHGEDLVNQYKTIAERKIEEAVVQDVLSRGANTPKVPKGGTSKSKDEDKVRPEAKAIIDRIKGLGGQGSF